MENENEIVVVDETKAEEKADETTTTTEGGEALSEEGQAVADLIRDVQSNPALLEDVQVKTLYDEAVKIQGTGKAVAEKKEGTTEKKKEKVKSDEATTGDIVYVYGEESVATREELLQKVDDAIEKGEKIPELTIIGDDKLITEVKGKSQQKTTTTKKSKLHGDVEVIENIDNMAAFQARVNNKFGFDLNTQEGIKKFAVVIDKQRKDSQSLADVETRLQKTIDSLEGMPDILYRPVMACFQDEDWEGILSDNTTKLDFTKGVDTYSDEELLTAYWPGEFSKEEISAYKDDPDEKESREVRSHVKLAKTQFGKDTKVYHKTRTDLVKKAKNKKIALSTSAKSSVASFKASFPKVDVSSLKQVENVLHSGDSRTILNLFIDTEGNYKAGAAEMLWYAMNAKDELSEKQEVIETQSANTKDLVIRSTKTPKTHGAKTQSASQEVNSIAHVVQSAKRKKTY